MAGSVSYETLQQYSRDLICLSGGIHGPIGHDLLQNNPDAALATTQKLLAIYKDRFYLEIMRHNQQDEVKTEPWFLEQAISQNIPIVATNMCYFPTKDMVKAHTALLCLEAGAYIGAENHPQSHPLFYLRSPNEMEKTFADLPEAIANTSIIAKKCTYYLKPLPPALPPFPKKGNLSENDLLTKNAFKGLDIRRKNNQILPLLDPSVYEKRLNYELSIITKMDFSGYFLIMSDIIRWAKSQGIPVGPGRGSAAGSLVAWSLFITEIDSLRFDLPFERFLNPDRVSMPDFDVDFCQDRREEVIEYVRGLYSDECVAQIITFGTLNARGVLRDIGRVYQLPYNQVDQLCRRIPNAPGKSVALMEAVKEDPILQDAYDTQQEVKTVMDIASQLEGLHRHASTHAAGIIICGKPVRHFVPLYKDPGSGQQVTQFTMKYIEFASLIKFDFLGLKTLTVLQKTISLLAQDDIPLTLAQIPFDDIKTFELLQKGDGHGVFQMESAGMQDLLRQSKPSCFEDLIAVVALYRPGPMENIPTYIARKNGSEKVTYLHPLLENILAETYGIPVYQEQVMKTAQVLANYTMGEADLLRRAMGKKIPKEMEAQKKRFLTGAQTNKVDEAIAEQIFDQMAKFAGYAFNKCHATCYALIAYQTAFMKANHLPHFTAASLTYEGGHDRFGEYKRMLERYTCTLLPVDIQHSQTHFTVETNSEGKKNVRYALSAIKGVGSSVSETIVQERLDSQFQYPSECFQRLLLKNVGKRIIAKLIDAGALDSLEHNRARLTCLFDDIQKIMGDAKMDTSDQPSFFQEKISIINDRRNHIPPTQDIPFSEKSDHELTTTGIHLRYHPLDPYRTLIAKGKFATIPDMYQASPRNTVSILAVVHSIALKKSQEGRLFTVLNIFDRHDQASFMLFQELAESVKNFAAGSVIHLRVQARQSEDRKRYQVLTVTRAQQLLQDITPHVITITIQPSCLVTPILQIINAGIIDHGPHTIVFHIEPCLFIKINRASLISESNIHQIKEMAGVQDIKVASNPAGGPGKT